MPYKYLQQRKFSLQATVHGKLPAIRSTTLVVDMFAPLRIIMIVLMGPKHLLYLQQLQQIMQIILLAKT